MKEELVKIVTFVPESHADKVREVMGDAGAGIIGNYHHCFFSINGIGSFVPDKNSNPTIGSIGKREEVKEIRIESVCPIKKINEVIKMIKRVHPYEEVPIDVYPLIT